MFKKTTLKNGLRIITVPQKGTQAVTVLVLVGTGSKYENKETNGISHFLEHMYFKGTKKRPTSLAVAETLDKVGGIYNAFTGEDYTGYFAKVAFPHFDLALDWVSDIYLNSLLPEKEIEKEKGVIIEEINMLYDTPTSYIEILWNKLLYGDQPAGWPITGTKENIARITRKDLFKYMKSQYAASNTIICVVGKIKESEVISKVKKCFSKIETKKSKEKSPVIEKQTKPNCLLHFRQTDQTHLALGVRAFNLFHSQRYTQELLGIILGGMMSARLFMEVRGKLGMAYYIHTDVSSDPDTGSLVTLAGVDNEKVDKAISTILKEYKKITEKKVPKDELKKAKNYTKGKMALILETSDALSSFYGLQELLEKKILTPEEIYKRIDQVTQSDILKVAKEIFQPKKLNLVLIGPFKNKEKFQKLLKL
ncbi:MAG: pitrilysin family protein [Patescibacteria group bacterium]|nr:pitrilysin family protein [Patescibacteria group bacterium]